MAASFVTSIALHLRGVDAMGDTRSPRLRLRDGHHVGVTTAVWLAVTLLTAPRPTRRWTGSTAGPARGPWMAPGGRRLGYGEDRIPGGALSWVNWVAGVVAVYAAVFAVGHSLTGSPASGLVYGLVAIGAFLLIQRNLRADEGLAASVDTALDPRLRLDPGE